MFLRKSWRRARGVECGFVCATPLAPPQDQDGQAVGGVRASRNRGVCCATPRAVSTSCIVCRFFAPAGRRVVATGETRGSGSCIVFRPARAKESVAPAGAKIPDRFPPRVSPMATSRRPTGANSRERGLSLLRPWPFVLPRRHDDLEVLAFNFAQLVEALDAAVRGH